MRDWLSPLSGIGGRVFLEVTADEIKFSLLEGSQFRSGIAELWHSDVDGNAAGVLACHPTELHCTTGAALLRKMRLCSEYEMITDMAHPVDEIQNDTLKVLRKHISSGPAALVDFPSHQNAGDSLIFAGEMAYLRRLNIHVNYVCDVERYSPRILRERVPEGPILLHGGGNLGDRWPKYQEFRKRVIQEFPDRKIVMLPQSMEFRSRTALEATKNIFSEHRDLTLLLREHRSFDEAVTHFGKNNQVEYCPDLAFGVGTQSMHAPARRVDVIQLLRRDSERVERGEISIPYSTSTIDWGLHGVDAKLWKAVRVPGRIATSVPQCSNFLYPFLRISYGAQVKLNLRRAGILLQSGKVLLTDRLHAAILGGLLGIPVVAMDNAYGKVSSIYADYLHKLDNVKFASSKDEALLLINDLVSSS